MPRTPFKAGTFIGDGGLTFLTVEGESLLEVGWHMHRDIRNRSLATEAGDTCLQFGFDTVGAGLIGFVVDPANVASREVARRVHSHQREVLAKGGTMLLYSTTGSQFKAGERPWVQEDPSP